MMARIEGRKLPLLMDSGAEVSVLPKSVMDAIVVPPTVEIGHRTVQTFGGNQLELEGPRCLQIEICGVKLVHPFFALNSDIPLIAGFDLMKAAKLVIDIHRRVVWSHFNGSAGCDPNLSVSNGTQVSNSASVSSSTSVSNSQSDRQTTVSYASVQPVSKSSHKKQKRRHAAESVLPTAIDSYTSGLHTLSFGSSSVVQKDCPVDHISLTAATVQPQSSFSSCVGFEVTGPNSLVYSGPVEAGSPSVYETDSFECAVPSISCTLTTPESFVVGNTIGSDRPCVNNATGVPSTDVTDSIDLPSHLTELYQRTVEDTPLTEQTCVGLQQLLLSHHDTFARDSTDLGFCPLLTHDIDTGDERNHKKQTVHVDRLSPCITDESSLLTQAADSMSASRTPGQPAETIGQGAVCVSAMPTLAPSALGTSSATIVEHQAASEPPPSSQPNSSHMNQRVQRTRHRPARLADYVYNGCT